MDELEEKIVLLNERLYQYELFLDNEVSGWKLKFLREANTCADKNVKSLSDVLSVWLVVQA